MNVDCNNALSQRLELLSHRLPKRRKLEASAKKKAKDTDVSFSTDTEIAEWLVSYLIARTASGERKGAGEGPAHCKKSGAQWCNEILNSKTPALRFTPNTAGVRNVRDDVRDAVSQEVERIACVAFLQMHAASDSQHSEAEAIRGKADGQT